jgi:L-fucose isomerase-like protein
VPEDSGLFLEAAPGRILEGQRLGVIGHPSDWLISSDVDYAAAREVLGAELIDIPMQELLDEIGRHSHPEVELPPLNEPKFGRHIPVADLEVALDIYGALLRLMGKYNLNGLTIRCFDLLGTVHNTGCMALALLNSQGFTATCEGDVPAMLSMAVARKVCGQSGFQANLSSIDGDRLLFAHCTVPLNMTRHWVYDTHFESGFGVAVHGELPYGPATIFKLAPDFKTAFIAEATLEQNRYENHLCRTQIILNAPGLAPYFLRTPIGNHHIILTGDYVKALKDALNVTA